MFLLGPVCCDTAQAEADAVCELVICVLRCVGCVFLQLTVRALDNHPVNPKFDIALVYITVDLDDTPYFQPSSYPQTEVLEQQAIGPTTLQVTARDNDREVGSVLLLGEGQISVL